MTGRDDAAFTAYVAGSQDRLRRTAYLMCGDWQRAADLTQEALIRVYVAWPRIEHKGGLSTYARRALMSAAIDQSRRRMSRELVGVPEYHDPPTKDDAISQVSERDALLTGLRALPARQRACLVLRYFEDLSTEETARVLDCSTGNVKSQTSRGLQRLREVLAGQGVEVLDHLVAENERGQR